MLRDLIGNENPRRTSFSIGQIEISALGVALANNTLVVCPLELQEITHGQSMNLARYAKKD